MSSAANLLQGWQELVPQIRVPHWLDQDDRTTLSDTITDLNQTTALFPTVREQLDAVLTELGVAEARDQVWPRKTELMRQAHGYPADVLPIRMSDEELQAVLAIPTLPTDLHHRLSGQPEKK